MTKLDIFILNFVNYFFIPFCRDLLGKKEKETIINSFVYSNFMYCPLTWHFCSKPSQNKIEKIQYRSLKMLTNDYNSDYKDLLEITKT